MSFKISIEAKEEIEKFILIFNIGILIALKKGLISIEDAEKILYSPYSVDKLRDLSLNEEVIRLIELGCELEDVESLIPYKLENSIDDIYNRTIELLHTSPEIYSFEKKWIE
ncbi:DUF3969 family protein [Anaerocolumna sp. AGMB13025]|uniref:DUF3969 family protein n=1 Tax=Anaerocolumna sp. AGMB13025 TaxID=3039116 RepID=UPI00241E9F13|nr:DUF3969 family protein [Anaerocolumna sp. AGMB13025]WFR55920.1 DUF3969 family protein [Anaerocolumna sp. AGMB13025]